MSERKDWTAADLQYLREHYATAPWDDMQSHLGTTKHRIQLRAYKLGLERDRDPKYACVIDYLRGDTSPSGAAFGDIRIGLGLTSDYLRTTLCRLARQGMVHLIGSGYGQHYVYDAARVAECTRVYEADRSAKAAAEVEQQKAAFRLMRERNKAKLRAALVACTNELGMTNREAAEAIGLSVKQTNAARVDLVRDGLCFVLGSRVRVRMFATQTQSDEAAPILDSMKAEHAKEIRQRQRNREREREPTRVREPRDRTKAKRVKPAALPGKALVRPAREAAVKVDARQRWASLPVVVPEGVKVKVCPSFPDYRFSVSPHFKGELVRDWEQKRRAA